MFAMLCSCPAAGCRRPTVGGATTVTANPHQLSHKTCSLIDREDSPKFLFDLDPMKKIPLFISLWYPFWVGYEAIAAAWRTYVISL